MAGRAYEFERRRGARADLGLGMAVYWAVVTVLALALLGMTVNVATPRDARDLVEAHAGP